MYQQTCRVFNLYQFPFTSISTLEITFFYNNFTICQSLYLNEMNYAVKNTLLVNLCKNVSTRIAMLLNAVTFSMPNLLTYDDRNSAHRLGFAFISFFFCFALFSSNFLLIYPNQTKINLMYFYQFN